MTQYLSKASGRSKKPILEKLLNRSSLVYLKKVQDEDDNMGWINNDVFHGLFNLSTHVILNSFSCEFSDNRTAIEERENDCFGKRDVKTIPKWWTGLENQGDRNVSVTGIHEHNVM